MRGWPSAAAALLVALAGRAHADDTAARRAEEAAARAEAAAARAEAAATRTERSCAYAADAYARTSGRPGVLSVTAGCGLTNAVTGLCVAGLTGSPVVCLAGQHPTTEDQLGSFQEAYGAEICRTFAKFTKRVLDWS